MAVSPLIFLQRWRWSYILSMIERSLLPSWLSILNFRMKGSLPISEKVRRYILMGLSIPMSIGGFVFLVYNLFARNDVLLPLNLLLMTGGLSGIILGAFQLHRTALGIILMVAMIAFASSAIRFNNGAENFLIMGIIASMLMFDNRLVRWSIAVIDGIFLNAAKLILLGSPGSDDLAISPLYYSVSLWVFLLGTIAFLEVFRVVNQKSRLQMEKEHKSLEQQAEELTLANESKESLFAILGHDLRGPVGNVRSFLEFLQSDDLSQEDRRKLQDELIQEVGNLEVLLDNLLGWASTQLQQLVPYPVDYRLCDQVGEVLQVQYESASRKNIRLINDVDSTHWVCADRAQIQTVLRNLVSNGIKFTPQEGEVRVSSKDRGDMILIMVVDSGIGISAERIVTLRSGNIQKPSRGTNREKGFGIGLRICDQFISANGARLSIDSTDGEGSQFYFSLRKGRTDESNRADGDLDLDGRALSAE
ncbi:sensor histidine kinase [Puniceicoccus vermicola]|uniref:histidine kinase n=1 Tax=Puniceicoccus vermicola TaxID=388746 RepID=A0A7X1B215_9BACT|nr:HAMP domain-containing sensor histidine kinase [Puniceicoccus vermicola]MBC2604029.1 HAMP domain-containing histidine kinase [Puniceicoccus vermicola]